MKCTKYWIAASISFFVGMIMLLCGLILRDYTIGAYFVLADWVLIAIGWVLWVFGLVNRIKGN